MKAAVIYENGGPDVLRYEDVPDPECPDACMPSTVPRLRNGHQSGFGARIEGNPR